MLVGDDDRQARRPRPFEGRRLLLSPIGMVLPAGYIGGKRAPDENRRAGFGQFENAAERIDRHGRRRRDDDRSVFGRAGGPRDVQRLLGTTRRLVEAPALGLGDEAAAHLGVPVEAHRRWLLVATSLMVGAAVAVSGLIGFVGLVVPHAIRLMAGAGYRRLIPLSMLLGASFLILADIPGRMLSSPAETRIGVVTAFVGGPFFVVVLRNALADGGRFGCSITPTTRTRSNCGARRWRFLPVWKSTIRSFVSWRSNTPVRFVSLTRTVLL